jgi:hypothetical protein
VKSVPITIKVMSLNPAHGCGVKQQLLTSCGLSLDVSTSTKIEKEKKRYNKHLIWVRGYGV